MIGQDNIGSAPDQRETWFEPPEHPEALIATNFLRTRIGSLLRGGKSISYHRTTGTKYPPAGTLIDRCTGKGRGDLAWDGLEHTALVRITSPAKLFNHENGNFCTAADFLSEVQEREHRTPKSDEWRHCGSRPLALSPTSCC